MTGIQKDDLIYSVKFPWSRFYLQMFNASHKKRRLQLFDWAFLRWYPLLMVQHLQIVPAVSWGLKATSHGGFRAVFFIVPLHLIACFLSSVPHFLMLSWFLWCYCCLWCVSQLNSPVSWRLFYFVSSSLCFYLNPLPLFSCRSSYVGHGHLQTRHHDHLTQQAHRGRGQFLQGEKTSSPSKHSCFFLIHLQMLEYFFSSNRKGRWRRQLNVTSTLSKSFRAKALARTSSHSGNWKCRCSSTCPDVGGKWM